MITIKLFGEGCHIHLLDSSKKSIEIYNEIASKMKLPLSEAILDISFFYKLNSNIQSIDPYNSAVIPLLGEGTSPLWLILIHDCPKIS